MFKKLLIAITAATGITASATASAETLTFAVGDWAPYVGKELDGYGTHAKIITKVFTDAGFEVKYDFMPWKRAYQTTKDGTYVSTFSWAASEGRKKEVLFPQTPIHTSITRAYYSKEAFPSGLTLSSYEDLAAQGLRGISVSGYSTDETYAKLGIQIVSASNETAAWRLLKNKRGDIFSSNENVVANAASEALGANYLDIIADAGVVETAMQYPLFSKNHPMGQRALEAWDAQ